MHTPNFTASCESQIGTQNKQTQGAHFQKVVELMIQCDSALDDF